MAAKNLIVIGASAGGVSTLQALVSALPADLDAAILIVLHLAPDAPSVLAEILDRSGPLPVLVAQHQAPILSGHIYVAPPAQHLLVEGERLALYFGPKENRFRPAIDVLFRSAALAYGPRVTGVVLTGMLDDGTAGLKAIKECGGIAMVQDPAEARFPDMPKSALKNVEVDYCLPIASIVSRLVALSEAPMKEPPGKPVPRQVEIEARIQMQGSSDEGEMNQLGRPSAYACPECHGALWEIQDSQLVRYRCRTGHAYTGRSLLAEQAEAKEAAMWSLLRGLEELESLANRLAAAEGRQEADTTTVELQQYAAQINQKITLMRQIVSHADQAEAAGAAAIAGGEPVGAADRAKPPDLGNANDGRKARQANRSGTAGESKDP